MILSQLSDSVPYRYKTDQFSIIHYRRCSNIFLDEDLRHFPNAVACAYLIQSNTFYQHKNILDLLWSIPEIFHIQSLEDLVSREP
mmetsp:Transcript_27116/g.45605  ORF Transcript_27116/g.45605 Transcript_27116/m.45605 type:complete len:85 (+) Transcript_27116:886-1140(+)